MNYIISLLYGMWKFEFMELVGAMLAAGSQGDCEG